MFEHLFFASDGFFPVPPSYSMRWNPHLVYIFVLSNGLIALSYFSILGALTYLVLERKDIAFNWVIRLLMLLILILGSAYVLEIWSIWHPSLWVEGLFDALTGLIMLVTTIVMWRLVPAARVIPNPRELEEANLVLQREIAEREKTEKSLLESERKFRSLVVGVTDYAIYVLDKNGEIKNWNLGAERISGYTAEEMIGKHFSIFFSSEDVKDGIPEHLLDIARSVGRCEVDGWRIKKGGARFWANSIVTALRDEKGILTGFSTVTRDLTERRQMEEITRLNLELSRSNEELQQFAKVAAHDLQEPLRAIQGYANLLSRRYANQLDEDGREFIDYIKSSSKRMAEQIQSVLTHSKISVQRKSVAKTNLTAVLSEVVANLKAAIEECGATIESDELPTITGNKSELVQLFQNLISNAIKFRGKEPPVIEITAKKQEKKWLFCVADNGIGIDPNYGGKIFEMFSRLHSKATYSGTGIGLAICQKIVESHGGKIWVESVPDQGSKFYFTIPAYRKG